MRSAQTDSGHAKAFPIHLKPGKLPLTVTPRRCTSLAARTPVYRARRRRPDARITLGETSRRT